MAELVRGSVSDRPWGKTLATLGLRGLTGQLTMNADGKRIQVAFSRGAVAGAVSPLVADAAVRIAMTGHLVSSTQVAEIARRQAAAPTRDEIELIAELARLGPEQALRLRRRVVAQRAARTFSIDRGDFVVEDQISIPVVPGSELDIRAVIYLGARQNLSESRLAIELGQLGEWFRLKPDAVEDLAQYGFTDAERPMLEHLRAGGTLAELEAVAPDMEARMVRAAVYALASCNACELEMTPRQPQQANPSPPARKPAVAPPVAAPGPAAQLAARSAGRAGSESHDGLDGPTIRKDDDLDPQTIRREAMMDPPTIARRRPSTSRPPSEHKRRHTDSAQASDVQSLIASRIKLLDDHVDHFALLGITQDTPPEAVRKAYFALARQLHPDRLSALGIPDEARDAQRLFAQVNTAFATLSDSKRRAEYVSVLRRGGEAAVRAEQAKAEEMALRVLDAEEAFRRGEMALRRDQLQSAIQELERAIELNSDEPDYFAVLAWAKFCASGDKMAVAAATRNALQKAIEKAPRSVTARFYLGRVERMLGKDQDALELFQEVIRISPAHAEASSEIRVIEARLASSADDKAKGGGLFGRLKRT